MRFTVRGLMLAVAVFGLNLAGILATSKYYPRPPIPLAFGVGGRGGYILSHPDGTVEYGKYDERGRSPPTRVEARRPRPTLLQVWSPVILAMSSTLLALALVSPRRVTGRSENSIARLGGLRSRKIGHAVRWCALVVAIVGLNLVGAVAVATQNPRPSGWLPAACRDGDWLTVHHADGTDEFILQDFGTGFRRSTATVWRGPRPNHLAIWAPLIASTSTSVVALVCMLRREGGAWTSGQSGDIRAGSQGWPRAETFH